MQQLIDLVSQKANISPDQAKRAVTTVVDFIKTKLPAGVNLDSVLSGKATSSIADSIGSAFSKK